MKKFSHRGRDNFEQLKFKDFQDSLTSNSKTFKTQFGFQEPFKAWKERFFPKKFQGPVASLRIYRLVQKTSQTLRNYKGAYTL